VKSQYNTIIVVFLSLFFINAGICQIGQSSVEISMNANIAKEVTNGIQQEILKSIHNLIRDYRDYGDLQSTDDLYKFRKLFGNLDTEIYADYNQNDESTTVIDYTAEVVSALRAGRYNFLLETPATINSIKEDNDFNYEVRLQVLKNIKKTLVTEKDEKTFSLLGDGGRDIRLTFTITLDRYNISNYKINKIEGEIINEASLLSSKKRSRKQGSAKNNNSFNSSRQIFSINTLYHLGNVTPQHDNSKFTAVGLSGEYIYKFLKSIGVGIHIGASQHKIESSAVNSIRIVVNDVTRDIISLSGVESDSYNYQIQSITESNNTEELSGLILSAGPLLYLEKIIGSQLGVSITIGALYQNFNYSTFDLTNPRKEFEVPTDDIFNNLSNNTDVLNALSNNSSSVNNRKYQSNIESNQMLSGLIRPAAGIFISSKLQIVASAGYNIAISSFTDNDVISEELNNETIHYTPQFERIKNRKLNAWSFGLGINLRI